MLLALSFRLLSKKAKGPSRLDLRAGSKPEASPSSPPSSQTHGREKALNVFFNYNGHMWDAYEVLGVPAGSSLEAVTSAFEKLRASSSPDARSFLDEAFEAILSEQNRG